MAPQHTRNHIQRWRLWLPWVLMSLPVMAILSSAREIPDAFRRAERTQIRIALNHWPGFEVLYLAQELGLFAAEGVDVRIVEVSSLADSMRALVQGHVDAIACTPVEAVLAADHGARRTTIIHAFDASHGGDVILAHPDVDSLAALKGRRVAIEPTSLTTVVLHEALRRAGLSLNDVETVVMDPLDMPSAFAEREVDAVVCYPPASVRILQSQDARSLFTSAEIPDTIIDVLAVDHALLKARPRDVRAILRAVHRATELANVNPDLTDPIMAAREGLTVEQFRAVRSAGVRRFTIADQSRVLAPSGPLERAIRVTRDAIRDARGPAWAQSHVAMPDVLSLSTEPGR